MAASSSRAARAASAQSTAQRTDSGSTGAGIGLARKSNAPAFIARTLASTLPLAGDEDDGDRRRRAASAPACRARPSSFGISMSSTRQPTAPTCRSPARNSRAEANDSTRYPAPRSTRSNERRTDDWSSTTNVRRAVRDARSQPHGPLPPCPTPSCEPSPRTLWSAGAGAAMVLWGCRRG